MAPVIPARESSKYARQYAGAYDPLRIAQIFADSHRIALSSKSPDTAADRFALAVEAYHQINSMQAPAELRASVQRAMAELVASFPTLVVINEALGLRERACKLKTPRKRVDLLREALEVIERGLAQYPSSTELQSAAAELRTEILGLGPSAL